MLAEEVIALAYGELALSLASHAGICGNVDQPAWCAQGPLYHTFPCLICSSLELCLKEIQEKYVVSQCSDIT